MIRRSVGVLRPPSPRRLRPQRRRWPMLLPLVPLAIWAIPRLVDDSSPTSALSPTTTVRPTSTLLSFEAPVGERTTSARCWMIVVDESSSMAEADEAGTRADAIRAATEFLATFGLADDRVGATWFADTANVAAPEPATSAGAAVASTRGLGSGTRISTALTTALDAMDDGCASEARVVVLVSDGQAADDDEFRATARVIATAGADVHFHMIAMNGNQAFEPSRSFWEDPALGIDSIRPVSSFGSDEVADAVAGILTVETGQQIEGR